MAVVVVALFVVAAAASPPPGLSLGLASMTPPPPPPPPLVKLRMGEASDDAGPLALWLVTAPLPLAPRLRIHRGDTMAVDGVCVAARKRGVPRLPCCGNPPWSPPAFFFVFLLPLLKRRRAGGAAPPAAAAAVPARRARGERERDRACAAAKARRGDRERRGDTERRGERERARCCWRGERLRPRARPRRRALPKPMWLLLWPAAAAAAVPPDAADDGVWRDMGLANPGGVADDMFTRSARPPRPPFPPLAPQNRFLPLRGGAGEACRIPLALVDIGVGCGGLCGTTGEDSIQQTKPWGHTVCVLGNNAVESTAPTLLHSAGVGRPVAVVAGAYATAHTHCAALSDTRKALARTPNRPLPKNSRQVPKRRTKSGYY